MLISLSRKFVFIANLKTASTSIEKALSPWAELALTESRFGKHMPYRRIEAQFGHLLDLVDRSEMLVFGVIRDPVDYMASLYNSHTEAKFRDLPALYTGGLDFDRFLHEWTARNADQVRQQHLRFLDRRGRLAADYLISYDRLESGLRFVAGHLGIGGLLSFGRQNSSPGTLRPAAVTAAQRDWIEAHFAGDREILDRSCNRLLTECRPFAPAAPESAAPPAPEDLLALRLVQALYRVLLLREPDKAGLENHLEQIRNGRPIAESIRGILQSREFARISAQFLQTYLAAPAPGEGAPGGERPETPARVPTWQGAA